MYWLISDANAFKEAFELGQANNAKSGGDDAAASEPESDDEAEVVNVSVLRDPSLWSRLV